LLSWCGKRKTGRAVRANSANTSSSETDSPVNQRRRERMVSQGGAGLPVWRRDGKELFYLALTTI
jgi:hypothetical protein